MLSRLYLATPSGLGGANTIGPPQIRLTWRRPRPDKFQTPDGYQLVCGLRRRKISYTLRSTGASEARVEFDGRFETPGPQFLAGQVRSNDRSRSRMVSAASNSSWSQRTWVRHPATRLLPPKNQLVASADRESHGHYEDMGRREKEEFKAVCCSVSSKWPESRPKQIAGRMTATRANARGEGKEDGEAQNLNRGIRVDCPPGACTKIESATVQIEIGIRQCSQVTQLAYRGLRSDLLCRFGEI